MAYMARRSQLLVRNGHRIGSNQHRVKVPSNVYLDQQQASTRSLLHFQERLNIRKCQAQTWSLARPTRSLNRVAAILNRQGLRRAVFPAPPPKTDIPRSRFRRSQRSGSNDIPPARGCPARSATDRNSSRSAHGSDRLSAPARTRLARACSRRACDRNSRSNWPRSGDHRGRAPSAARSRRHSRCARRSLHRRCGNPG